MEDQWCRGANLERSVKRMTTYNTNLASELYALPCFNGHGLQDLHIKNEVMNMMSQIRKNFAPQDRQ